MVVNVFFFVTEDECEPYSNRLLKFDTLLTIVIFVQYPIVGTGAKKQ